MDPTITNLYSFVGSCHKKKKKKILKQKISTTIWVYKISTENENRKWIQSQHKSNKP